IATLAHAVLREDAGFHAYQMLEAGVRQFGAWGDTDEGRHILVAVARYLAAHSPTERASLQTADIARRLMRGGELHQEADRPDVTRRGRTKGDLKWQKPAPVNRLPAVRLRIPASQSIGVVTFNGDQQRLIENQARRSAPSLEANFDLNQTNEPILGARASSRSMRGSVSCR